MRGQVAASVRLEASAMEKEKEWEGAQVGVSEGAEMGKGCGDDATRLFIVTERLTRVEVMRSRRQARAQAYCAVQARCRNGANMRKRRCAHAAANWGRGNKCSTECFSRVRQRTRR